MRWPWQKQEAGVEERWDEDVDEEQDGEERETEEEAQEPELPPETQALIEKTRAAAIQEAQAQVRAAAQKRGLAWTGDDFAVADYGQFAQGFGFAQAREQERPESPPPSAAAPPEDEMPDPSYDAPGFAAWLRKRDEQIIQRTVEQIKPEFERLQGSLTARDRVGEAVQRAREMLPDLGFGHIAEHPRFEERYREGLLSELAPEQWSNPRALAALAGAIAPDLKEQGGFPAPRPRSRDEEGRFARDEQRRMLDQFGASRGAARLPRGQELTREDRRDLAFLAQVFPEMGGDVETVMAAEDSATLTRHIREKKAKG